MCVVTTLTAREPHEKCVRAVRVYALYTLYTTLHCCSVCVCVCSIYTHTHKLGERDAAAATVDATESDDAQHTRICAPIRICNIHTRPLASVDVCCVVLLTYPLNGHRKHSILAGECVL